MSIGVQRRARVRSDGGDIHDYGSMPLGGWKARKVRQRREITIRPQLERHVALDRHEIQTEANPTGDQWLALHRRLPELLREPGRGSGCPTRTCWWSMTPWDASKDTAWRLGDGGVAYGLGVYLGDRGLLNYLTTMTSEDEP